MQRGFSLLELVVVLAIILTGAVIAVPRIGDSIAIREIEDTAQQLAADMRWAQQEAINRTADMTSPSITFYSTGYVIEAGLGNRLKPFNFFPASIQLLGTVSPISFKLDGKPVAGTTVSLKSKSKPSLFRYVILLHTTGRVRVVNSL